MTDSIVAFVLTNTLIAALLGLASVVVWRTSRNAAWTHGLLLLALAKLVTPSFVSIEVPWDRGAVDESAGIADERPFEFQGDAAVVLPFVIAPSAAIGSDARPFGPGFTAVAPSGSTTSGRTPSSPVEGPQGVIAHQADWFAWDLLGAFAVACWILGGLVVTAVIVRRGRRFASLIRRAECADEDVITMAGELATQLRLLRVPDVRIVDARISPLVFRWLGRSVVVLPRLCTTELDARELRAVLAHELSHIANRDHLTRWLETAVAIVHWWNPIAGWIRGQLRESEELRCDGRAVSVLESGARHYGRTILKTVSYVDGDLAGLPLAAAGLGSPESLKMRLQMIAQQKTHHRLSLIGRSALALGAAALLPLGLTAQDPKPAPDRAAKIDQIRQLLRELRQEVTSSDSKSEASETVEVKAAPKRVIRWLSGDGDGKPGQVVVEEREAHGEAGAESPKSGTTKTRRLVVRSGEAGEPVAIEVNGEAIELPEMLEQMEKSGAFKFDIDVSGDDEDHPKGMFKLFGSGTKGDDDDADDDDDDDGDDGSAKAHVFHLGKGVGGAHSFVWRTGDGDDSEVHGQIKKLIEAHADGDGKPHAFVLRSGGGEAGDLPAHVKKLLEAHADGDGEPHAIVLRSGDGEAGDLPAHVKQLIEAHAGADGKPHTFVLRSGGEAGGDHHSTEEIVEVKDLSGLFHGKVVAPSDVVVNPAKVQVVHPFGATQTDHQGVFVIRGDGEDAPGQTKALRVRKREKAAEQGDDDSEIKAQIEKLEAQLRAIEKKLEKLRSREV